MPAPTPAGEPPSLLRNGAVRRCLLAVTVLHDLDLSWADVRAPAVGLPDLQIDGPSPIRVSGEQLSLLFGADDPEGAATVGRVARWLLARREVDSLPAPLLFDLLRVVGLPVGHVLHPGSSWVRAQVPGGALTLGLGLLHEGPAELPVPPIPPLPPGVLEDAGVDVRAGWAAARQRLEELGALAAARRQRRPRDPIRPMAEADVVTLLGSSAFRTGLAESSNGLIGLIVPMRHRGWVSSSSIDPAFGPAAAAATAEDERGFSRPLLVTADEVVQVPAGGHPLRHLGYQAMRSRLS
jgi:hypothetical protein